MAETGRPPLPPWLKVSVPSGEKVARIRRTCAERGLNTVCASARCPNLGECWGAGTATFMILGGSCTRGCRFCSVPSAARPPAPRAEEPGLLAETAAELGLRYVVLTTVCRDDLPDQGAGHIAACIRAVKRRVPRIKVEILMQDFTGDEAALRAVAAAAPDIIGHNLETVERLSPAVRDGRCGYRLSLRTLAALRRVAPGTPLKSSLMLGLGENDDEVAAALRDLRGAGVDLVTIGQYLRPTGAGRHLPVARYVAPEEFQAWSARALGLGFKHASCGPFVRSSYHAAEAFTASLLSGRID
ncbi:MAG: lipoyl synthase [Elusimicrobia bacterium]|nr:lipoyl synthase [Elusimicrobiota bacterium]